MQTLTRLVLEELSRTYPNEVIPNDRDFKNQLCLCLEREYGAILKTLDDDEDLIHLARLFVSGLADLPFQFILDFVSLSDVLNELLTLFHEAFGAALERYQYQILLEQVIAKQKLRHLCWLESRLIGYPLHHVPISRLVSETELNLTYASGFTDSMSLELKDFIDFGGDDEQGHPGARS